MILTTGLGQASTAGTLKTPVAQRPIRTQGTQTIMMQIGCRMTVVRNVLALRAVSQFWNRCGNMPTDNGMNR